MNERVARVAEERGEYERQRMLSVRRSAMLDSAQLYHDLASTIGSSLTDLVRKRRQLDQNTRERAHIVAALDTTTSMTTKKNLRQQQVMPLPSAHARFFPRVGKFIRRVARIFSGCGLFS